METGATGDDLSHSTAGAGVGQLTTSQRQEVDKRQEVGGGEDGRA